MTREENIKAILEAHFTGFKDELIDSAVTRIVGLDINLSGDYVSRESIVNKIHVLQDQLKSDDDSKWNRNKLAFKYMAYVNGIILNEPSVQSERPKGKWIQTKDECDGVNFYDFSFECSKCGKEQSFKSNYCPNCGAYMREGGEDDT